MCKRGDRLMCLCVDVLPLDLVQGEMRWFWFGDLLIGWCDNTLMREAKKLKLKSIPKIEDGGLRRKTGCSTLENLRCHTEVWRLSSAAAARFWKIPTLPVILKNPDVRKDLFRICSLAAKMVWFKTIFAIREDSESRSAALNLSSMTVRLKGLFRICLFAARMVWLKQSSQ